MKRFKHRSVIASLVRGVAIAFLLFFLVACSDDDSGFISRSDGKGSSSSVTLDSNDSSLPPCKMESKDGCEYGILVDDRDNQTYKTVKIGSQWWMAENLNLETVHSYCYNDSSEYCDKFGRLYLWSAAMDSMGTWSNNGEGCGYYAKCSPTYPVRGVCPEGWHLPTKEEWEILIAVVGDSLTSGKKLKSSSGWNDNGNGTDSYSFTALPGGSMNKGFIEEGIGAFIWSSIGFDEACAYNVYLNYNSENAYLYHGNKNLGFSVRCIKDE